MKKTKILVPAIAVLALGLAASTTATVAWYQASNNASISNGTPVAAGTLTVGQTVKESVNNFTIVPTAISGAQTVALTATNGKTYVSVPTGNNTWATVEGSTTAAKAVAYELKAKVTYSGDLTVANDVKALWESTCTDVTLTLSCASVAGEAIHGDFTVNDIRGVASTAAAASGDLAKTKGASAFTWSSATTTAELSFGTIYVAITGSDDVIVDADHLPTYTLQIAASHTEA